MRDEWSERRQTADRGRTVEYVKRQSCIKPNREKGRQAEEKRYDTGKESKRKREIKL